MAASPLQLVAGAAPHGLPVTADGIQCRSGSEHISLGYGNIFMDASCPPVDVANCGLNVSSRHLNIVHPQRAKEESLWRCFFSDPASWYDNRHDKKSSRSPDFRHRWTKEVLWLNSFWKPAWVDDQLAALDVQQGLPISTSHSHCSAPNGKFAGSSKASKSRPLEMLQLCEAVDHLDFLVQTHSAVSLSFLCTVLKSCIAEKSLFLGRRVHEVAVKGGYESNATVATHILRMYASHGCLQEAKHVFSSITEPDSFSWSAVIAAHSKLGEPMEAIRLYHEMRSSGVKPDCHVFLAAVQACVDATDLKSGRQLHADVLGSGVPQKLCLWNCMVDMYAKCGCLEDSRKLFDSLLEKDVVTWNIMISRTAQHERVREVFYLYEQMMESWVLANPVTFACLLKACGKAGALQQGKQIHSQILQRGFESDTVIGTCLVDMYAKCGKLEYSRKVFDKLVSKNVVTWTTMIAGYARQGRCQEALSVYDQMERGGLMLADPVTYACLLMACARAGALQQGKQLHVRICERGLEADVVVGTCLVDMYAKCGRPEDARNCFENMPAKTVVAWTAMIAGYVENGLGQEALALYNTMEHVNPDLANPFTFACLLKVCGAVGALQQGERLHSEIVKKGLETDPAVGNSLVDMYAKCGRLNKAHRVFESLPSKDVLTWTIMINAFGLSNECQQALLCYEDMIRRGIQANETTYTCLLAACSHEGLVKEGEQIFQVMVEKRGIMPTIEHRCCMVDLFGRAGYLEASEDLLLSYESNDVGFMALLNACKIHGDVERGRRCFESLVRSNPQNSAAYVLMEHIYADAGRSWDAKNIARQRKSAGARKKPAVAGIEVAQRVHTFVVGDNSEEVSSNVCAINLKVREQGGHVPHTELVMKQLTEKEKENELCGHAEKLALAYGLFNTPDGTPLLVTKNLRMCSDCHRTTEILSRIERREIVVRDASRVHRFVDGSCRCAGRP